MLSGSNALPAGGLCVQPCLLAAFDEIRQTFGAWSSLFAVHTEIRARVTHVASGTDGPFIMGELIRSAGHRLHSPPLFRVGEIVGFLFLPDPGPWHKPVFVSSELRFVHLDVFHDSLTFPRASVFTKTCIILSNSIL
jgi:hypothetical protein